MNIEGYEQLADVLKDAYKQAAEGKGKERHANDLPFHDQRMQQISNVLDSDAGMAFQAIKKLAEGRQFDDLAMLERELLGAINYIAGIVIYHRLRKNKVAVVAQAVPKKVCTCSLTYKCVSCA